MNNRIRYTCAGYKSAPESFKCYLVILASQGYNHSYYELKYFSKEDNCRVGMVCIEKGKREAEAEIKRIVRNRKEDCTYITYGYKIIGRNLISYIGNYCISNDADIHEKLKMYKTVKEIFKEQNYIIEDYTLVSYEFDDSYKVSNLHKNKIKYTVSPIPKKIKWARQATQLK